MQVASAADQSELGTSKVNSPEPTDEESGYTICANPLAADSKSEGPEGVPGRGASGGPGIEMMTKLAEDHEGSTPNLSPLFGGEVGENSAGGGGDEEGAAVHRRAEESVAKDEPMPQGTHAMAVKAEKKWGRGSG